MAQADPKARLAAAIAASIQGFTPADARRSWAELGLDSFALLSLRLAAEEALGRELTDAEWLSAASPGDLLAVSRAGLQPRPAAAAGVTLAEQVRLSMPHMAMGGLSEGWLFRALGDLHWRLVGAGLGVLPHQLADAGGRRIFPAFGRIRFEASAPLGAFEEGETLAFEASLQRFGAALFFSNVSVSSDGGRSIGAELMSSFAYPALEAGRLAAAQPVLPERCAVPGLEALPAFAAGFAERRQERDAPRPVLARCRYALQPQHDLNGLGLLYCAAYPVIADICEMRAAGDAARWGAAPGPLSRDVFYFGNAGRGAALEWRLHEPSLATLARDDGTVVALIETQRGDR
ncbi:MAG TPA: LnmK family bifunctional acyltransferase/decarboxylase [Allosphingosinicella sp.]|jgi:probable biosynthetic protein (TIGR04098 family)